MLETLKQHVVSQEATQWGIFGMLRSCVVTSTALLCGAFHLQTCLCLLSVYLLAAIPCWGRKSIYSLLNLFQAFLWPLEGEPLKICWCLFLMYWMYLPEVNSVGCSTDHMTQLDLKGVRGFRLSFSKKWAGRADCWFHAAALFLSVRTGKLKAVLDLPLLGVYSTAELSFGCFDSIYMLFKILVLM